MPTTDLPPEECKRKWADMVSGLDEPEATIAACFLEAECRFLKNRPAVDQLADLARLKSA